MAEINARQGTIDVSDDGGSTWFKVSGITQMTMSPSHETIDTTDFDSNGYKESEYGETQYKLTASINIDETDAGQVKIQTAMQNKTKVTFRVRNRVASGAKQYTFLAKVNSFELAAARNAIVVGSLDAESSGTITINTQP